MKISEDRDKDRDKDKDKDKSGDKDESRDNRKTQITNHSLSRGVLRNDF